MKKGIIGKKVGMTQIFDENGRMIPVTVVQAGPCTVVQKKERENNGYAAIQLGYGDISAKRVTKPLKGHFDKADVAPRRTLREFRFESIDELNVGDIVKTDIFEVGDIVDVVGTSKGKGFTGVIKRWGFKILVKTHGTHKSARSGGSFGNSASPGKVAKGKKQAGHVGHKRTTIQNLTVVKVDVENNLLAIKGAIPGPRGSIVIIADAVKQA